MLATLLDLMETYLSKLYIFYISGKRGVHINGKVWFLGIPLIEIADGASLDIGDRVILKSKNKGYHINMHSPVKLVADREGAEIRIGQGSRIFGACIHARKSVVIGRNCLIAANCQIMDSSGHDLSFPDVENRVNTEGHARPIVIEDDVWIGANSIVLPGVTIGRGSVISAGSVVVTDVPPMVVVRGNPAVVVKDYNGSVSSLSDGMRSVGRDMER